MFCQARGVFRLFYYRLGKDPPWAKEHNNKFNLKNIVEYTSE